MSPLTTHTTAQLATLTSARSISAALFAEAEHADDTRPAGSRGLTLAVIRDWLDEIGDRRTRR
jgi:hypothetical protein